MAGAPLPFGGGCFDVAILHLSLAVVPDPVSALREGERMQGIRLFVRATAWADDGEPVERAGESTTMQPIRRAEPWKEAP